MKEQLLTDFNVDDGEMLVSQQPVSLNVCNPGNGQSSRSPRDHSSSGSSPEQAEVKFEAQKSVDSDSKVSPTQVIDCAECIHYSITSVNNVC